MQRSAPDERIAQMDGPAALPRKNGELVFDAPWEGRIFGLAVALSDRRVYDWGDFRTRLVDEIAVDAESAYYESWLAAFEKLLLARGLLDRAELDARTDEYASGMRTDEDDDHDHEHG